MRAVARLHSERTLRRGVALVGQVPPCSPFRTRQLRPLEGSESRLQNKPSEDSFDSRRGATLETFASRSGQTGLGARSGRACEVGTGKLCRYQPRVPSGVTADGCDAATGPVHGRKLEKGSVF